MLRHNAGNLVFALSAAVDVLVVLAAVAWAVRRDPLALRLAVGLAVACTVLLVKLTSLLAAGLGIPFGVLHVLWLDLVVVLPLAGVVTFVFARDRGGSGVLICAGAATLLAPVGVYASFIEPGRLVVERADVDVAEQRGGEKPVTVGVIADLQFERMGDHEREAINRMVDLKPDVIVLPGDYHQGSPATFDQELPGLRRLFERLRAPGGVYAVQGDAEDHREMRRTFRGTGVRVLWNGSRTVRVRDRRLTIAGVALDYRSREARDLLDRLENRPRGDDVRLLVAHRPDVVLRLDPFSRVDLVVAGHTHGGQFQLPGIGPLHIASRVPRRVGAGGLNALSGRDIYVSRGVGVERGQAPKLRLGAPPEISLITLR